MKRKIYIAGIILLCAAFLFSGFMVYRQYADDRQSTEAFDNLAQLIPTVPDDTENSNDENIEEIHVSAFEKYADIYALNNDLVGWISIDDTAINYPVMQTKDRPNYYLKKNFEKQYSDYGVPYVSETCDIDISDNTVIYGHHMKNGTMFSGLESYKSKDFYESHTIIHFDTLGGYGVYEVIAVFKTVAYSDTGFKNYQFDNAADEIVFNEYVTKCKELSLYDTGVTAEYGDKLITLSTCEYSNTNGRLVVVAKKVAD